ncbi:MAG: IPExxxVDY family protein [Taibaiella sp.]|nr:IPExxxVDY family protein [Taibaiella sp.]
MAKLVLDTIEMSESFFADTAFIGIASPLPSYRFCWLVNNEMNTRFVRQSELDIFTRSADVDKIYFQIFQYDLPLSDYKYLIYKLKNKNDHLLPEVKQLDYLWMVQSQEAEKDAELIAYDLRKIPDIQLAQLLDITLLKKPENLLL